MRADSTLCSTLHLKNKNIIFSNFALHFLPLFVCLLRRFLLFDPTWSIFMKASDSKVTFFSPPDGHAIWKRDLWLWTWILWTLILHSYEMKTEVIELSIGLSPPTEGVCPFWLQTETNYNECRFMYVDIVPSLISKGHRNAMDTSLSASCREFVNMATTVNKSVARQTDQASLFFVQMLLSQTLFQVNRSPWMWGF